MPGVALHLGLLERVAAVLALKPRHGERGGVFSVPPVMRVASCALGMSGSAQGEGAERGVGGAHRRRQFWPSSSTLRARLKSFRRLRQTTPARDRSERSPRLSGASHRGARVLGVVSTTAR